MDKDKQTRRLFKDGTLFDDSFEAELEEKKDTPVKCLGMTFPNDRERRRYFLDKLQKKLKDKEFRKIDGFPMGEDDDILALSDPPYYTACPNPFLEDFINYYGRPYDPNEQYRREPFAADVSEGKNDPIYNAHSYHTKVPHKAIMRYILHYTKPGDIIFDGFCGTGMTGVAAKLCGDKDIVGALNIGTDLENSVGHRYAILNDICPSASFISYNYTTTISSKDFLRAAEKLRNEVNKECGWMWKTIHTDRKSIGAINYIVWSDVFICPECSQEIVFHEVAVDRDSGSVLKEFQCSHCKVFLAKRNMDRSWVTKFDKAINQKINQAKQIPVLINYNVGQQRFEKKPDKNDLELINKIDNLEIPYWYPTDRMPDGEESRRNDDIGITHVHHFYTRRSLWTLAKAYNEVRDLPVEIRNYLLFTVQQAVLGFARISRYVPTHFSQVNQYLSGTLYIGSQVVEVSLDYILLGKIKRLANMLGEFTYLGPVLTETSSTTMAGVPPSSVDYIFTDPPFGGNLMYSELNFLWESWIRVLTNNNHEAITNTVQGKGLPEYQALMAGCFKAYYDCLKPGRWMTVEFHNSKNSVWNAIQEALQNAGFVVADVRTLDKQHSTFKQITGASAVKQDLIISAYKPNGGLEERFKVETSPEEGVWDFVRTHLKQLPVFVCKEGRAEVIAERQNFLLYDRMVAFHVQRGVTVPLSAAIFYAGLTQRFPERDGMFFLPDQVAQYDKKRITVKEILQLQLFVIDESSAIQWLKQQLTMKPQTFKELHPQFMKEIGGWNKQEKPLELLELLDENFLCYDGKEDVPSQIHSYISTNFKDLRKLLKDDPTLKAKAKDRWYIPDPNKAGDIEKIREKALLREFEEYKQHQKKFKNTDKFRLEAVRAGFSKAWQERDYDTIINVANKIPENILQEDPKLLMWYDGAMTRTANTE